MLPDEPWFGAVTPEPAEYGTDVAAVARGRDGSMTGTHKPTSYEAAAARTTSIWARRAASSFSVASLSSFAWSVALGMVVVVVVVICGASSSRPCSTARVELSSHDRFCPPPLPPPAPCRPWLVYAVGLVMGVLEAEEKSPLIDGVSGSPRRDAADDDECACGLTLSFFFRLWLGLGLRLVRLDAEKLSRASASRLRQVRSTGAAPGAAEPGEGLRRDIGCVWKGGSVARCACGSDDDLRAGLGLAREDAKRNSGLNRTIGDTLASKSTARATPGPARPEHGAAADAPAPSSADCMRVNRWSASTPFHDQSQSPARLLVSG